jgi:hypothetical protein
MNAAATPLAEPADPFALPPWVLRSEGFAEDLPGADAAPCDDDETAEPPRRGLPGALLALMLVVAGATPVWALAAGF